MPRYKRVFVILLTLICACFGCVGFVLAMDYSSRHRSVDVTVALENLYGYESYAADITYTDLLTDEVFTNLFFYQTEVGYMKVNEADEPIEFSTLENYLNFNVEQDRWQVAGTLQEYVPGSPSDLLQGNLTASQQLEWTQTNKDLICAELNLGNNCVVMKATNGENTYYIYTLASTAEVRAVKIAAPDIIAEYKLFEINNPKIRIDIKLNEAIDT